MPRSPVCKYTIIRFVRSEPMCVKPCKCAFLFLLFSLPPPPIHSFSPSAPGLAVSNPGGILSREGSSAPQLGNSSRFHRLQTYSCHPSIKGTERGSDKETPPKGVRLSLQAPILSSASSALNYRLERHFSSREFFWFHVYLGSQKERREVAAGYCQINSCCC